MVADGPRGTYPTRPGAPGQEQVGSLLPRAPDKLPPGAGAASGAGAAHNLHRPVGSGAGVHAAQPGRAPACVGWSVSARRELGHPRNQRARMLIFCRVRVLDPQLNNVGASCLSVSAQIWDAAFLSQAILHLNCHETEISGSPNS